MSINPKYSKIVQWAKLISVTGFAQIIVQGLGLVSGILIIRLLPTKEYALYTLVNTMLGTMTVLADGGIGAGVMAQGGKVWKDGDKLGEVLVTGLSLRKKFAIGSLLVAVPILFYLLMHNGASTLKATIIVITLIPAFVAALSDSLLEIAPKLHQDINSLQKNQIIVNILRFLMLGSLLISPFAAIAILAAGIPRMWGNLKLKKISAGYANWHAEPNPNIQRQILRGVKRILPGSIYYCVSGQVTIWIISVFGNSTTVAQVGALGRLSMMLSVVSIVFTTLIIPSFSKLPDDKTTLLKNYVKIQFVLIGIGALIVGVAYLFPTQILWLLGKSYGNLGSALVKSILGSCIVLASGIMFGLYTARGWAINPVISVPINVSCIILGILVLKVSTIEGALLYNIFIASAEYLINALYCLIKIIKSSNHT
ncbi:MATE family efflux transporter [Mucilaginibacter polytrichastri]|nr:polysaccharide biosynthesis protein [Mucilaginibacter polytrichastri]